MTIHTLKSLRLIIPGFAAILAAWTLQVTWYPLHIGVPDLPKSFATTVVALVIGGLYQIFDFRKTILHDHFAGVRGHILTRLKSLLPDHIKVESDKLWQFYWRLIDNDASLKERSAIIRSNGLLATSCQDIAFFSFVGFLANSLAAVGLGMGSELPASMQGIVSPAWIDRLITGFLLLMAALATQFVFLPQAIQRHTELVDDQLNFIATNKRPEIEEWLQNN